MVKKAGLLAAGVAWGVLWFIVAESAYGYGEVAQGKGKPGPVLRQLPPLVTAKDINRALKRISDASGLAFPSPDGLCPFNYIFDKSEGDAAFAFFIDRSVFPSVRFPGERDIKYEDIKVMLFYGVSSNGVGAIEDFENLLPPLGGLRVSVAEGSQGASSASSAPLQFITGGRLDEYEVGLEKDQRVKVQKIEMAARATYDGEVTEQKGYGLQGKIVVNDKTCYVLIFGKYAEPDKETLVRVLNSIISDN